MRDTLFHFERTENSSIQSQIREMLVSAILNGQLPSRMPLPSSRKMAKTLKVSRNTVVLAYQGLVDDGYLTSRERSGFYVNPEILEGRAQTDTRQDRPKGKALDWQKRFKLQPGIHKTIKKPLDWLSYKYPFISNQVDPVLFPIAAWRECTRQAMGKRGMDAWTSDTSGSDDPQLIEQIKTRLLPRRGIMASNDEILITLGAQNGLYLLASLLVRDGVRVGFEDPGYPDARNIFSLKTEDMILMPVDRQGLPVDDRLDQCDYVYVTPSHQSPTTHTMPMDRRKALLQRAEEQDFVIIEDDYESETNYASSPTPALKSLDTNNRVVYVGSLSKTLFPGLRLGYLVASADLIHELRLLRLLMVRHTPNNNQRTVAYFLALGHHDTLIHRLHRAYRARWQAMAAALDKHFPGATEKPTFGGTSFWVKGRENLDSFAFAEEALAEGIVIEPGTPHFAGDNSPKNFFRLGLSSIPDDRIEPGIELLSQIMNRHKD
jgi:GntR family transcriptional regulator / MocR family aminotransferase